MRAKALCRREVRPGALKDDPEVLQIVASCGAGLYKRDTERTRKVGRRTSVEVHDGGVWCLKHSEELLREARRQQSADFRAGDRGRAAFKNQGVC